MKMPKEIVLNTDLVKTHGVMVGYIYSILKINSSISRDELANLCNTSVSTIKRTINYMIEQKIINRIESVGKENTYQVIPLEGEQAAHQHPDCDPKQPYGKEGIVMLTKKEYAALIKKHGERKTKDYIDRIEEEYHRSGRIYHDCAYIINKWIEQDKKSPAPWRERQELKKHRKGDSMIEQEKRSVDKYLALVETVDENGNIISLLEQKLRHNKDDVLVEDPDSWLEYFDRLHAAENNNEGDN